MRTWKIMKWRGMVYRVYQNGALVWRYIRRIYGRALTKLALRSRAYGETRAAPLGRTAAKLPFLSRASGEARRRFDGSVSTSFPTVNRVVGRARLTARGQTPALLLSVQRGGGERRSARRGKGNRWRATVWQKGAWGQLKAPEYGAQTALFGRTEGRGALGASRAAQKGTGSAPGEFRSRALGLAWFLPQFDEETGVLTLRQVQTATGNGSTVEVT